MFGAQDKSAARAPSRRLLLVRTWNTCQLMKQITHAIDEDPFGLPPPEGQCELICMLGHSKAILVPWVPHGPQSERKAFRVAVLAARTDLCAASKRVPGCVGPFDAGTVAHATQRA